MPDEQVAAAWADYERDAEAAIDAAQDRRTAARHVYEAECGKADQALELAMANARIARDKKIREAKS